MKVIPLTRGKYTLVDDEDYERLSNHSWAWIPTASVGDKAGYAVRKGNKRCGEPRTVQMHREILGLVSQRDNFVIDHISGDSLDNRKENLRICTTQRNAFNRQKPLVPCTSKFKGVFRRRGRSEWTARIRINDRHVELGCYQDEEVAAAVYNYASRLLFGPYRRENEGCGELPAQLKQRVFETAKRYAERYGWSVDTDEYQRCLKMEGAS